MAEYIINFTDPTVPGISIPALSINGPGELLSNTTLRLFGESCVGWGESVNENFVRLLENFMGATAPINPVAGQLWAETRLFYRNSGSGLIYRYDIDPSSGTYHTWVSLTFVSSTTAPVSPSIGTYWYNTSTGLLYQYQSAYDRAPATWMLRGMTVSTGVPVAPPTIQLKMYDARTSTWGSVSNVLVSTSSAAPSDGQPGNLRFDAVTDTLYVWDGASWIGFVNNVTPSFNGNVNMNNNSIINLANAVNPTDALNLQTADGRYVNISGDTMVGNLTLAGNPTAALHAAPKQYVESYAAPVVHTHTLANISDAGTAAAANTGTLSTNVPLVSNVVGEQTIWVPAVAILPRTTTGAGSTTTELPTNKITFKTLNFDPATEEFAQFYVYMPKSWNGSTVTARFIWSHPAAATNFGVVWGIRTYTFSDGDQMDMAFGAEQIVADVGGITDVLYHSNKTPPITLGGGIGPNDVIIFQVSRKVGDPSDLMSVDARLHGVTIYYNTNALNDA